MHFCNDERATVTAEQKRLAGDSFKQTLVMTKLGALWRELPEARKATYNQKAKEDKARYDAALKAAGVLTKAEKKAQGPQVVNGPGPMILFLYHIYIYIYILHIY